MTKAKRLLGIPSICAIIAAICISLVGCGECEHTYDDNCDTTCNACGNVRFVSHNFSEADCDSPKICADCGIEAGNKLGHVAEADDGDCTTARLCENCDYVFTEARDAHVEAADDGDCTTAVTCEYCDYVFVEARDAHVPEADDGDCTTARHCENCNTVTTEALYQHSFHVDPKCLVCDVEMIAEGEINGNKVYFLTIESLIEQMKLTTEDSPASIKLAKDITVYERIGISGYFTLDLNGKTLKSEGGGYVLYISSGSVTLFTRFEGGKIVGYDGVLVGQNSSLRFESGSIISSGNYGINLSRNATVEVIGEAYVESGFYAISSNDGCTIHVNGGTLKGKTSINYSSPNEVLISGGTIIGKIYDNLAGGSSVSPVISGGSFPGGIILGTHVAPFSELLAAGYSYYVSAQEYIPGELDKEISGEVIVAKHPHVYVDGVCSCGELEGYYDEAANTFYVPNEGWLVSAFARAGELGTAENPLRVVLIDDIYLTEPTYNDGYIKHSITLSGGVVILDLNGYELNMDSYKLSVGINMEDGADLTVNDTKGGGKIVSTADYLIYVQDSSLTVNDGTLETSGMYAIYAFFGVLLDIRGGSFKADLSSLVPQNCKTIKISGGEFLTAIELRSDTPALITGGVINVSGYDFNAVPGGLLGFDSETGEGAYFPDGINIRFGSLSTALADGAAYFDESGNQITEGLDGGVISGGVYVKRSAN